MQLNIQTTPAKGNQDQQDKTDYAALMAASLAAVFAVVAAPGRWDRFSMLLGITLLGVLFGYFGWESKRGHYLQEPRSRLNPRRWIDLRAFAFAALVGLCAGLATAWLAQLYLEDHPSHPWVVDCPHKDVTVVDYTEMGEALEERRPGEECISGRVTGIVIPLVWIVAALGVYGWLLDLYPRRRQSPSDSEPPHTPHGPATAKPPQNQQETPLDRSPST